MNLNNLFPPLQRDTPLANQLSFRLARNVIFIAVPLGIAFIIGQMLLDFSEHKQNLNNTATAVFNIVEEAATHIIWTMDKNGGQSLVTGLLGHDAIVRVDILNSKGNIFATAEKSDIQPPSLTSRLLFDSYRTYNRPLSQQVSPNSNLPIGKLRLTLDPRSAAEKLVKRFSYIVVSGLFITTLLAGALFCLFHFSIVQPLLLASNSLYRILPHRIGAKRIHLPTRHKNDELGRFIQKTNELLTAVEENVSSREKAEKQVRQLNKNLEAQVLDRTKGLEAFTYSVTHDLRTSVRTIEGFSNAILEDCGSLLNGTGKTYLGFLQEASRQMNDHIDALLELSKTTSGGINRENFSLSDMARQICKGMARSFTKKPVLVHIPDDLYTFADRRLTEVVLKNLFENAFKYTSKEKHPEVSFGADCKEEGSTVYFIKDNGTGFDMSHADKLFLPFRRIHRHDDFSGTGIGLATVERIILRHNGKIWAESKVDHGTVFYFTLD